MKEIILLADVMARTGLGRKYNETLWQSREEQVISTTHLVEWPVVDKGSPSLAIGRGEGRKGVVVKLLSHPRSRWNQ